MRNEQQEGHATGKKKKHKNTKTEGTAKNRLLIAAHQDKQDMFRQDMFRKTEKKKAQRSTNKTSRN